MGNGGILALPTDTVYGLAADPANSTAVKKLENIKKRESGKFFVQMVADVSLLRDLVEIPDRALPLIRQYWPGALTLIFKLKEKKATLGVRIPDFKPLLRLLTVWARPLAVTSANLSGEKEINSIAELKRIFGSSVDYYWDVAPAFTSVASTIADVSREKIKIIRQGEIKLN